MIWKENEFIYCAANRTKKVNNIMMLIDQHRRKCLKGIVNSQ